MGSRDRNKIGVPAATAVGLGAIIGAGIYVLSGTAVALAGAYALVAFAIVGVLAIIIALELGELGSLMPSVKGASYSYTYNAFGSELGFITGMLRYTALATSISAISLGFGSYLSNLIGIPVATYAIPFAISLIAVLSVINLLGVKKAAQTDLVLVTIKIGILLLFVGFAISFALAGHHADQFANSFAFKPGLGSIFAASVVVFFAYSGYQSISTLTDKIRGGASGYVRSILSAVAISIVIYLLVVIALLLLLPPSSYKVTADPLSYALKSVSAPQWLHFIVDIGALIATASATVAMILSSSRSLYQMSADRLLPKFFRKYNRKRDAAVNGILVSALIGVVMLFSGNIYIIASIANFGLMFDYLIINFDIVHFRRLGRKAPFMIPLYPYLPILGTILLAAFFTGLPKEALVVGVILIIALFAVYYLMREVEEKKIVKVRLFR